MRVRTILSSQQKVTTQTLLVTNLLRLSSQALDEAVAQEVSDNPALEHRTAYDDVPNEDSVTRPGRQAQEADADQWERIAHTETPIETLVAQARLLAPAGELALLTYLIHCLDEHGFLRLSAPELAAELGVAPERVERGVAWLHEMEPCGIGARDVRECLMMQCARLKTQEGGGEVALSILERAWDDFVHQRWRAIARATGYSLEEVHNAVQFIRTRLYLFPVRLILDGPADERRLTHPDLIIRRSVDEGRPSFRVEVPFGPEVGLRVSPAFLSAARRSAGLTRELQPAEQQWVSQSVERARTFIEALHQRRRLLAWVGEFLAEYQADFFAHGPRHLKPLTRAQVAHHLGVHESTISRAVSDKSLQLPDGRLIELGEMFDASLAAKEAIRELLEATSEPLSDREIVSRLGSQSFDLSRRTVAKYRQQLNIPGRAIRQRRKFIEHQRA